MNPELQQTADLDMVGEYLAASHFHSLRTPQNQAFVSNIRRKYGDYRVTGASMDAIRQPSICGRKAVQAAGTDDVARIRDAWLVKAFEAPGKTRIDPATTTAISRFILAKSPTAAPSRSSEHHRANPSRSRSGHPNPGRVGSARRVSVENWADRL